MLGRHKGNTTNNYNSAVARLEQWGRDTGADVQSLHQRPSTDVSARIAHSVAVEVMLCRYVVYLVEVQCTVQPRSASNYAVAIRSVINDFVGYDVQTVHTHTTLVKLVEGLDLCHPHQASRRDPLLQQHLLEWSRTLNLALHTHRVMLALAVTTWGTTSRFGDLCPRLLRDFDPLKHVLFEDVQLGESVGFITIKDHKTKRRSNWAPKTLPLPEVSFPIVVAGVQYNTLQELSGCTSPELPPQVILSPYFQLARLMKLSGATDPKSPLFFRYGGKPVYYDTYATFVKVISARCGHQFIKPHSGRSGGETAMEATGVASVHTLRTCGYWSSEKSTHFYGEATTENQSLVLQAIARATKTDLAIHHARPGAGERTTEVVPHARTYATEQHSPHAPLPPLVGCESESLPSPEVRTGSRKRKLPLHLR